MDEKKLRVYTTAVSIAGLSVFLLSLWEVYPYYLPGSSRGDIWSYSLMTVSYTHLTLPTTERV